MVPDFHYIIFLAWQNHSNNVITIKKENNWWRWQLALRHIVTIYSDKAKMEETEISQEVMNNVNNIIIYILFTLYQYVNPRIRKCI